jgi:hypothetical protein
MAVVLPVNSTWQLLAFRGTQEDGKTLLLLLPLSSSRYRCNLFHAMWTAMTAAATAASMTEFCGCVSRSVCSAGSELLMLACHIACGVQVH